MLRKNKMEYKCTDCINCKKLKEFVYSTVECVVGDNRDALAAVRLSQRPICKKFHPAEYIRALNS
jgi:hypothetical protein